MKLPLTVLLTALLTLTLPAQRDLFTDLGSSQDEAKDQVLDLLLNGHYYHQAVFKAVLAAPLATRLVWIKTVATWAKAYVRTPEFLESYRARRAEQAPQAGEIAPDFDTQMARQQKEFAQQIADMKKNLGQLPAEMRGQMEKTIQEMEKQFKAQRENKELAALMKQGHEAQAQQRALEYQRQVAAHEEAFPEQPRLLIARQLQRFLDLAGEIDFDARLELRGGRKRFVNPAYESQSSAWKLLFRAGRETVNAACDEARAWLRELSR